jgi:hypothetical protein
MNRKEIEVKKLLIQRRNIVKQKLNDLKEGHIVQEQSFLPITKRLQTIAEKLDGESNIKSEEPIKKEVKSSFSFSSPRKRITKHNRSMTFDAPSFLDTSVVAEGTSDDNYIADGDNAEDNEELETENVRDAKEYIQDFSNSPAMMYYLNQLDPLPREYVHKMIGDVHNEFDFRYGVRYDPDHNELKIGNSALQFDGNNLIIGGLTYNGTPGLYELIFKKHPIGFTEGDRKNYLDIVKRTNANKRNYSENEQIQGNGSYKYKKIISALNIQPLTPRRPRSIATRKKLGLGMLMEASNNPIDYVYWDDPNELIDRLRLLVSSQTAGHTGHVNEIVSIIEELRESKIIE